MRLGCTHAPSLRITQVARRHPRTKIVLKSDGGREADAMSILSLLSLGVVGGSTVTVVAEGEEEMAAIEEVAKIIESYKPD